MRFSHLAAVWMLECARGRSTIWYWRQVLIAMCTGVSSSILDHKVLALRALGTGCAVNALWLFLWSRFLHLGLRPVPEISFESIASLLLILLTQVVTGWVVARTHRAHGVPMVLLFGFLLVTCYLAGSVADVKRLLVNSIDQPRFRAYLAWYLTPISIEVAGLLCGGVIGARPKRHREG
jgi:hypothetical protein